MAGTSGRTRCVIAVDLGGTKILVSAVDADYSIMYRAKIRTDPRDGAQAVVDRIAEAVGDVVRGAEIPSGAVVGIGVGAPGPAASSPGTPRPTHGWRPT